MRIGVLSDTHDQVERTRAAVNLLAQHGADVLFHCGDITGVKTVMTLSRLPSYVVFGNNDHDRDGLRVAIAEVGGTCLGTGGMIEFEGCKVAAAHGDLKHEIMRLRALSPDWLLLGHSHRIVCQREVDGSFTVNPGALHRAKVHSVALIDLASSDCMFFDVRTCEPLIVQVKKP